MTRKLVANFDLDEFSTPFRAESDRACAVLGAALLDSRLESLYERRLRNFKDELLSKNGALSTSSSRIRVANAPAWISEDVRFDLDQIRSIRNDFAHKADCQLSFSDPSIADRCRTLRVAQVLIDANEHAASTPHPNFSQAVIRAMGSVFQKPRQRYEVTVEMLAQHIDELAGDSSAYEGPDFRQQLWVLGSTVTLKVTATATVGPPVTDGT